MSVPGSFLFYDIVNKLLCVVLLSKCLPTSATSPLYFLMFTDPASAPLIGFSGYFWILCCSENLPFDVPMFMLFFNGVASIRLEVPWCSFGVLCLRWLKLLVGFGCELY